MLRPRIVGMRGSMIGNMTTAMHEHRVVVVVLTSTHIIKSVVTGRAPVTLEWRIIQEEKKGKAKKRKYRKERKQWKENKRKYKTRKHGKETKKHNPRN